MSKRRALWLVLLRPWQEGGGVSEVSPQQPGTVPPSAACQSPCRSEPSPGHGAPRCQREAPLGEGARSKAWAQSLDLQWLPL